PSSSMGASTGGSPASSLMPGIVACTKCGSRYAQGVRFCGRCGGANFAMVTAPETANDFPCPRCGVRLPEHSRFCGRCGLNITPAMMQQSGGLHQSNAPGFTTQRPLPPQAERLCRRCGSAYPAHIKFCGRCGVTL
ncbi:MAG: zinc ribbon domain-containing protein, partial [Blastocatellia bacterium]|nr:zinc ribbon domain-containing protein [Blastocatellia bacterium]